MCSDYVQIVSTFWHARAMCVRAIDCGHFAHKQWLYIKIISFHFTLKKNLWKFIPEKKKTLHVWFMKLDKNEWFSWHESSGQGLQSCVYSVRVWVIYVNFVCSKLFSYFLVIGSRSLRVFSLFPFLFNVYLPISTHNYSKAEAEICWLFFHLSITNRFLNALFSLWAPQNVFKMADVKLLLNADCIFLLRDIFSI